MSNPQRRSSAEHDVSTHIVAIELVHIAANLLSRSRPDVAQALLAQLEDLQ